MGTTSILCVFLCFWASSINSLASASKEGCKSQQYLEIGKPGIINCSIEHGTYGAIEWYYSTAFDKPIASYNGSRLHDAGSVSNEYEIHRDGSLRIRNVSSKHLNNFTLKACDRTNDKAVTYVVSVFKKDDLDIEAGSVPKESYSTSKNVVFVVIVVIISLSVMVVCAVILVHKRANFRRNNGAPDKDSEENIPMFQIADVASIAPCIDIPQTAKEKTLRKHLQDEYKRIYGSARNRENEIQEQSSHDDIYIESAIKLFVLGEGLRGYGRWKRMDSRHEVFENFLNEESLQPSVCILDGNLGFGKSFLTLQLAYDWCTLNPMSPLRYFQLLILLRMRELQRPVSLAAAIKQLILPGNNDLNENDIDEVLKFTKSCLVILDGFEQYPCRNVDNESEIVKLSRSEIFQNLKVIVTTRVHTAVKYDVNAVRVRMEGFDEKSRDDFISQLFSNGKKQVAENLRLCFEEYPDFCQLCEAPVFYFAFVNSFYKSKNESVTNIVRNIESRFYSHNQIDVRNETRLKQSKFHSCSHSLSKIAFQGIINLETINWEKVKLRPLVGDEFYDLLVSSSILIEWNVIDYTKDLSDSCMHYMTMVGFYNRIICQWYAAQYIRDVFLQGTHEEFTTCLQRLLVRDISLVLRFICGMEQRAVGAVTKYLKTREGLDHLPVMCIMEQYGDRNVVEETVEEFCASSTEFKSTDSAYQQKISLHFLEVVSKKQVSIARVVLKNCFGSTNLFEKCIILTSGERFSNETKVCDLVIIEEERSLTVQEFIDIIWFANECKSLETLRFQVHLLTETLQLDVSQTSNMEILWSPKTEPLYFCETESSHVEAKDVEDRNVKLEENLSSGTPTMDEPEAAPTTNTDLVLYAHYQ